MTRRALALILLALGCSRGPPGPAALDTRNDACAFCRMTVSDAHFAAQLVAPGEEPRFFDDVGCLRSFLEQQGPPRRGAVAYVADHRTAAWVRADRAVYTRAPPLETPMGSHVVAHADEASRAADPAARGGELLRPAQVFGGSGPPGGTR